MRLAYDSTGGCVNLEYPVIVFVCLLCIIVYLRGFGGQYIYMGRHSPALLLKLG